MSNLNRGERIEYIDLLRIVSIFGVIVIHVSAVGLSFGTETMAFFASTIYNSLVRWSVPVFFMISGAMFLRNDREYTFSIMLKNMSVD